MTAFSPQFLQAFKNVVGEEGGYDTNPLDPGNWTGGQCNSGALHGTKFGISANAYPNLDIRNLTLDAARQLYYDDVWVKLRCDSLSPPLALHVFDAGVNNGPGRAIRWLQMAVGATVDGELGDATIAAAKSREPTLACTEFLAQRIFFQAQIPTWHTFGLGWSRRLANLPNLALAMPR